MASTTCRLNDLQVTASENESLSCYISSVQVESIEKMFDMNIMVFYACKDPALGIHPGVIACPGVNDCLRFVVDVNPLELCQCFDVWSANGLACARESI